MSRAYTNHRPIFLSLTLGCITAAWWGCATPTEQPTSAASSSAASSGGGSATSSGDGVGGHVNVGDGGPIDDGACASTSVTTQHVQLDMVILVDRSGSMSGAKWMGTTSALTKFFNDPASIGISAGILYMPNPKASTCFVTDYDYLTVPIDVLPKNAFALTNSMPADATGSGTPTYGALKGALLVAAAHQDAHPTHKVVVVLATDGDPDPLACQGNNTIDAISSLAKNALNYNGVRTFVIAAYGATVASLSQIAAAGGTTEAYDVTTDINQFFSKIAEIRQASIGCDFELPPPPNNQQLDPDKVNFSYTPKGVGMPIVLPRANDIADCNGKPGWYYDNNLAPTKITLCPASCSTVQADQFAKVEVLFGCKSLTF
ncbi:MAG: VWA domain-containing protein [Minicystis sp.]